MNTLTNHQAASPAIVAKMLIPAFTDNSVRSPLSVSTTTGEVVCFMGTDRKILDQYIRTLAGIHPIAKGSLEIFQQPIENIPAKAWSFIRTQLAYISRDVPLLSVLSGLNNVVFPSLYHGQLQRDEAIAKASDIFNALGYAGNKSELPAFMEPLDKIQLALARAIMLDPKVLLLDDPWYSLDPHEYSKLNDFFHHWVQAGAIIMATSNMSFVKKYATQLYFVGRAEVYEFTSWSAMCHSEAEEVRHYLRQHSE